MTTQVANEHVLEIDGLDVWLGRPPLQVLHEVSLDVAPGEVVGLIGETGSGKSTIARAALGLAPVASGTIRVDGEDVHGLRGRRLRAWRRRGAIQYVFQDPLRSLDPDFTIARSVLEGVPASRPAAERRRLLDEVLERVGLEPSLAQRVPAELSGGQRQRAAIARAIAVEPAALVCDEPVSALDAASRVEILDLLKAITTGTTPAGAAGEEGDVASRVGTLLITHDLGSLIDVADRVVVLFQGRVVERGPTIGLLSDPQHPYTRLLVASVPPLHGEPLPAADRLALRAEVEALSA